MFVIERHQVSSYCYRVALTSRWMCPKHAVGTRSPRALAQGTASARPPPGSVATEGKTATSAGYPQQRHPPSMKRPIPHLHFQTLSIARLLRALGNRHPSPPKSLPEPVLRTSRALHSHFLPPLKGGLHSELTLPAFHEPRGKCSGNLRDKSAWHARSPGTTRSDLWARRRLTNELPTRAPGTSS